VQYNVTCLPGRCGKKEECNPGPGLVYINGQDVVIEIITIELLVVVAQRSTLLMPLLTYKILASLIPDNRPTQFLIEIRYRDATLKVSR
jgi:hypothetical protein